MFDEFKHSLLSVGKLCDHDCTATFTKAKCVVTNKFGKTVVKGNRHRPTGLWHLEPQKPKQQALAVTGVPLPTKTLQQQVQFLHEAAFAPSKGTWINAIKKGHFATWPGLNVEIVNKHLPKSVATSQGHLDQQRKNLRSTKPKPEETDEGTMHEPTPLDEGRKVNEIYAAIEEYDEQTGKIHSDLTGPFPVTSNRGNKYVLVVYDYDSNAIIARPVKNRKAETIAETYEEIFDYLTKRGLRPKLQRLDNEASQLLKDFLNEKEIKFQLAPPYIHRRNAAERAIRTFKNHFIAGLCTVDTAFPLNLWCRLVDQAERTLNMLRTSRINPKMSAYAQLEGTFDYNATPIAPPGMKVVAHEKPEHRQSWSTHGLIGWYIGPAMEHYRCYRIYIPETKGERVCDTVDFFPQNTKLPQLSAEAATLRAAQHLISTLKQPHPEAPFLNLGDEKVRALETLADIFHQTTKEPGAPATGVGNTTKTHPMKTRQQGRANASISNEIPTTHQKRPLQFPARLQPPKVETKHAGMIHDQKIPSLLERQEANTVSHPVTGNPMEYRQLIKDPVTRKDWQISAANEFGRLAQGVGKRIKGTDTIKFIRRSDVPKGRSITYAKFVCQVRAMKAEQNRTRLTVGGNRVDYPFGVTTKTADITTFKMHINSVVSRPKRRYCTMDVKNFYLNTPMNWPEFMRIHIDDIPEEIILQYNLRELVHTDGYVYIEIGKGMYGLPQAGILANELLQKRLAKHGYRQVRHTPGYWRHDTRPIDFTLVVDDFGVSYEGRENAEHLLNVLKNDYEEVSIDWEGTLYCGISMKWDYNKRTCELSMPGYVEKGLARFHHPTPTKPQYSPYPANERFTPGVQHVIPADTSRPSDDKTKKRLQQIIGVFLFYARAVDPTMQTSLSKLASDQTTSTGKTEKATSQFLDYAATNPNAIIKYYPSDMILKVHSDASYLSEQFARSRAAGHFYLGNKDPKPDPTSGPILNTTGIITNVMSSAVEAETSSLYCQMKEAVPLRRTLEEMGHPQPATPVQVDNSTADGIANDTVKANKTRAMDMRLHWIQDNATGTKPPFNVYWAPGRINKADYHSKQHPPTIHKRRRSDFLHIPPDPTPAPTGALANACCGGVLIAASSPGASASRSLSNNRQRSRPPISVSKHDHIRDLGCTLRTVTAQLRQRASSSEVERRIVSLPAQPTPTRMNQPSMLLTS